jgi:tetratricopeptide (TPR) repeat protein
MPDTRLVQIQEMLKAEPNDSFLNYLLSLEYGKLNDIYKAIDIIETLLFKDENYLGAYYQLGKYYEQTDQPEKAVDTYKKGILVAQNQKNKKAQGELNEALWMLED